MEELKQVEEGRGRCHRQGVVFHVVNEEFVGARGGRKIPVEIVWKQDGSGLGAMVFNICSCKVLYAHVRYHNGNGTLRTMPVPEWVSLTGKGHFRRLEGEEKAALDEVLAECDKQKSFFGARMATIVTSISSSPGALRGGLPERPLPQGRAG